MKKFIITIIIFCGLTNPINAQWNSITSPSNNTLYSVTFLNSFTGYISGATSGTIIKTTDSGLSWIFQSTGTYNTFYDIFMLDAATGYAAGSNKSILKTTNAGLNWLLTATGTSVCYNISFPSPTIGYVVGGSPSALEKSTNFGSNWTSLVPPSAMTLKGVRFNTNSTGWVCGNSGVLYKTTDGCVSWIPQIQSSSYNLKKYGLQV